MYLFPIQKTQVNTDFEINLEQYITKVKNEINYLVTNRSANTFTNLKLIGELPSGLVRAESNSWIKDCDKLFTLHPGNSCILRFFVDEEQYTPTNANAPLICSEGKECFAPITEDQFNNAVTNSPGPTHIQVTPQEQNGLSFNSAQGILSGKPISAGVYEFEIGAYNKYVTSQPRTLRMYISNHPTDKLKP